MVSVLPPQGNLPAWVNALAIGQWYSIPNTALSSVGPSPTPSGASGPASKVIAWTSFVVDTRTSKVYSVANGGHQDYAGNEVDVLELERDQPFWSQILAPTPNSQLTNCQSYYADGRPTSRHTYYGVTLDEFNDRIMLFGGAHWCTNGGFHAAISSYNISANSYNGAGTHPNLSSQFVVLSAYALNPATGDVYVTNGRQMGRWNRGTNTFANMNAGGTGAWGTEAMSAFDSTRGRVLVLGGLNNDRQVYTLSNNAWTTVTLSGTNAGSVSGRAQGAMFYVPTIDRYLVLGSGGTVYQINAGTFEVTTFPTMSASIPSTQNGPYNKFLYVPRLGGAVYVPTYSGNAWFLRIH
jgi:hypothetical protein